MTLKEVVKVLGGAIEGAPVRCGDGMDYLTSLPQLRDEIADMVTLMVFGSEIFLRTAFFPFIFINLTFGCVIYVDFLVQIINLIKFHYKTMQNEGIDLAT